jgi:hypothetical protein
MSYLRQIGIFGFFCVGALSTACAVSEASNDPVDSVSSAINPGQCNQVQAKDTLIAALVKDSWIVGYPLTRLSVNASGSIVGPSLPDVLAGDIDLINTVPAARASVAAALVKVTGLAEYGMAGIGPDTEACSGVPAWTPSGSTTVNTASNQVFPSGVNEPSWRTTHQEFGKECPLIKRLGNRDIIDPPGDGSTNLPSSQTVSASGVTANAYGLCAPGTAVNTYCKLSYATGVNYTGRTCQLYYGSLRCLLY